MSSMIGEKVKISLFGQSHGEAVGVVIDGLPAGVEIDLEQLQTFLNRRAPGRDDISSSREEADVPRFLSGLISSKTCGAPLCAVIANKDVRSADYQQLQNLPRPSHADYPASIRYGGNQDIRGGGHFSGRLTTPLCVAGGIALQILAQRDIFIGAHVEAVGKISEQRFSTVNLREQELHLPKSRAIPVLDESVGLAMKEEIQAAVSRGDSVGGIIECAAINMPPGIGSPIFDGMENALSRAIFGIPAVRGIEFGSGFAAAAMRGSEHNDAYCLADGKISTVTNHHGGIIGGLTTGMPIIFRVAIKPTPSIAIEQQSVNLSTMSEAKLTISGRHDPCIVLRAVPCVEAVTALVLLDNLL